MKALVIVDMQYDFLPGGALAVTDGDEVIPVINQIQQDFELIVATQDWHPAGHQSFASSHPGHQTFDVIDLDDVKQVLWPDHCVQGSLGAELSTDLDWRKVSAVFRKGMDLDVDSYSGFFDNNQAHRTGMAGYLRDLEVKDIYICGLAADYCVYYTARDGQALGFQSHFIANATRPISQEGYEAALQDLSDIGAKIVDWPTT